MAAVRPAEKAVRATLHLGAGPAHHAVSDAVVHRFGAGEIIAFHVHGVHVALLQQLGDLLLLELLHHGGVAGIAAGAHDDALRSIEQRAGAVLCRSNNAGHAAGLVLHEHPSLGVVANVGAVIGQIGMHAGEELLVVVLRGIAQHHVDIEHAVQPQLGLIRRRRAGEGDVCRGEHFLDKGVHQLARTIGPHAPLANVAAIGGVAHDMVDDLLRIVSGLARLLLELRVQEGTLVAAVMEDLVALKHDDFRAVLQGTERGKRAGHRRADDHHVGIDHVVAVGLGQHRCLAEPILFSCRAGLGHRRILRRRTATC